jgi:hypothetical protein
MNSKLLDKGFELESINTGDRDGSFRSREVTTACGAGTDNCLAAAVRRACKNQPVPHDLAERIASALKRSSS